MADFLYRALLRLFPRSFRRDYGEDMLQLFREGSRASIAAGGRLGKLRLWCRTLKDMVGQALLEHVHLLGRRLRPSRPYASPKHPTINGSLSIHQDIRQALYGFRNNRSFAIAAILMIGVGIGATTTIFSIVDHVLLRPLPYPHPGELVTIGRLRTGLSIPDFEDVRDRTHAFESLGAVWDWEQDLTGLGNPERVNVGQLTAAFLSTLGARSGFGRLFVADDFEPDAERTAVLSQSFWKRHWGRGGNAVGTTITLDGMVHEVVGVLSRDFVEPEALTRATVDVWVPLNPPQALLQDRSRTVQRVVARLADGRDSASAQLELDALALALAEQYPEGSRNRDGSPSMLLLRSLREVTVGDTGRTLSVLMGAVVLMLLIACTNVANLLLARGTYRSREMALRMALGASRRRLIRLLFVECLVLGLVGGTLGVVFAALGVRAFAMFNAGGLPRIAAVTVDWRVVAFALILSVLTGVLFGLLPAFRSAKSDLLFALKEGATTATGERCRNVTSHALMIVQFALALVLLVGAGLLFNSFLHLRRADPGFNTENVLTVEFRFGLPFGWGKTRYAEADAKSRLSSELLMAVRAIPGVLSAGGSLSLPFAQDRIFGAFILRSDRPSDTVITNMQPVTHGYLETLGVRLMAGRTFTASEDQGEPYNLGPKAIDGQDETVPVLVNRTLARRLWPDESPLGAELVGLIRGRVVGVIDDVSHLGPDLPRENQSYVPFQRTGTKFSTLVLAVRYIGAREAVAVAIRETVRNIDPDLPVGPILTMDQRRSRSMATPRFYSILFAFFATVAFLLAASGIYASMMYLVGQRQRELGIRLALGGKPQDLLRMVLCRGALLTVVGVTLGLAGALVLSRLLDSFVFGITTADPITYVCVSLLLGGVAMLACLLPAKLAAGADPVEVLRAE